MGFVVGLTGGIGSGKSVVAEQFAAKGVPVIDTDRIAHGLTAPSGAALPALRATFGSGIFDVAGRLDRAALRELVFADAAERKRLEAILHPLIREESARQLASVTNAAPYTLLVVPLLVETGAYRDHLDRVLAVDCAEETQLRRVMARNGCGRAEAERILATQAGREARLAAADDVIVNEGELSALTPQVDHLHRLYLGLAHHEG
ncbi:MAG: dephospho-CoA kinase [Betaproteobacteria bacterium HGW-Betaproteobacteria-11]|nr:MAG: dephospho-CoA kinase [Betaproteobacteria bacterium HGW-Betaproteobacteria-11]